MPFKDEEKYRVYHREFERKKAERGLSPESKALKQAANQKKDQRNKALSAEQRKFLRDQKRNLYKRNKRKEANMSSQQSRNTPPGTPSGSRPSSKQSTPRTPLESLAPEAQVALFESMGKADVAEADAIKAGADAIKAGKKERAKLLSPLLQPYQEEEEEDDSSLSSVDEAVNVKPKGKTLKRKAAPESARKGTKPVPKAAPKATDDEENDDDEPEVTTKAPKRTRAAAAKKADDVVPPYNDMNLIEGLRPEEIESDFLNTYADGLINKGLPLATALAYAKHFKFTEYKMRPAHIISALKMHAKQLLNSE